MENQNTGLLKVDVKSSTVIAGQPTTINLLLKNPFSESIYIESIEAPSSSLLKKEVVEIKKNKIQKEEKMIGKKWDKWDILKKFLMPDMGIGWIYAHFSKEIEKKSININLDKNSKLGIKGSLEKNYELNINSNEGNEILLDLQEIEDKENYSRVEQNVIEMGQEDIASFEIQVKNWLFIKPRTLELYAIIRYRIGDNKKSQIIPINLHVQPPTKSIIIGTTVGGTLGYISKQLTNTGISFGNMEAIGISLVGVIIMSVIAAVILSKREESKGFITLEDFYGAFFVGTMIGYIGTEYFDNLLSNLNTNIE